MAGVDVRIGVTYSPRELEVELPDDTDADGLASRVEEALRGADGMLWLTDRKGRRIGVPADKLAWVEIGSPSDRGRVGFGA
jgi:hypothetical protein